MSFPFLANTVARAFPQGLDPDELERQRRVKRAGSNPIPTLDDMTSDAAIAGRKRAGFDEPTPPQALRAGSGIIASEARLYGAPRVMPNAAPVSPQPSISRAAPVVDVTAGSDGVFRRAGQGPAPNTLSAAIPDAIGGAPTGPMRATYEPQAEAPAPRPVDRQHVDFSQPNPMDALAVQRATPQPFAADVDEGPVTRRAREMGEIGAEPHKHGSGFGERLMHGLKLGGSAFLRSGFNPLIAAGEFAEGAIDPNAWHRYEFGRDYPRAVAAAHNEQGMQEANMQRATQRVAMTGEYAPGIPTEAARSRHVQQDFNRVKQEELDFDRTERRKETARNHDLVESGRRRRELGAAARAGMLSPSQRQEYAKVLNLTGDIAEPFIRGDIELETDADGNFVGISKRALQQGKPAVTSTGVGSLAGVKADRQQAHQKFMEGIASGHLAISQKNADTYRWIAEHKGEESPEAEAFRTLHKEGKIDERGMAPNPKWQAEYNSAYETWKNTPGISEEEARAKAEARANRKITEGKTISVTELDEFKGLKASIKARPKAGKQSVSDPRIGKTFKDKKSGKQYRVTGIDADGQPIGVPIQ